jgi:hypothetical protein
MKKYFIIVFICLLSSSLVYGQEGLAKVGTAGNQFLKIGLDAKGAALAGAVAQVTNDSRAVFWNPALLTRMNNWSVAFTHSSYLADMTTQGFSFGKYFENIGYFALFGTFFSSGDMEETTVLQPNGTGRMFQTVSYSVGIGYARYLTERFAIGANFKYISEDLTNGELETDVLNSNWAIDIGAVYYPRFKNAESLGIYMYIRNFGPENQLSGTHIDFDQGAVLPEEITYSKFQNPLNFYVGIGYDFIATEMNNLSFAAFLQHPNDNVERGNFGLDYTWNEMISLRGGYVLNHDSRSFSGGVGFNLKTFDNFVIKFDYAYVDYGILDSVQFLTASIDW